MASNENGNVQTTDEIDFERNLRVIFVINLKWTEKIVVSVNKANIILGMLSRTFESRVVGIWKQLYTSMVRPHL